MADRKALTPDDAAFVRRLVIFKDADVLAFNKPAGLSSQGGRIAAPTLDDLMAVFAKPSGVRPRLVHRLDRDTSGVILAARSQPAAAFLGRAMMSRRVRKTYLAIVGPGAPSPASGVIEAALARQDMGRESYVRVAKPDALGAKPAFTRYRTLAFDDAAALVELSPRTGRMHQLRVHLASIGRPIIGDARYGGQLMLHGEPASRLMLHALAVTFPHPAGGERTIEAPPPTNFAGLAARIGA
ncbi:MAG TPA: RluA family pseudouridine synthase [Caulobacteraceae bacterium]